MTTPDDLTARALRRAFGEALPERSLVVTCPSGLGNRLRVLLSGLAAAEASRRVFAMLWPRNAQCAAGFADLFENAWNVVGTSPGLGLLPRFARDQGDLPDLLRQAAPHVVVTHYNWLLNARRHPGQAAAVARCETLFHELRPRPELLAEVQAFQARHFAGPMIGVHLRRGDALRARPWASNNTRAALRQVEAYLSRQPAAGILLCTDDGAPDPATGEVRHEGLRELFRHRYGARAVWRTPRTLARNDPAGVQDAVIDLWLLRQTDFFVGTAGSSFSAWVFYGRSLPYVMCGQPSPAERWLRATGRALRRRLAAVCGRR